MAFGVWGRGLVEKVYPRAHSHTEQIQIAKSCHSNKSSGSCSCSTECPGNTVSAEVESEWGKLLHIQTHKSCRVGKSAQCAPSLWMVTLSQVLRPYFQQYSLLQIHFPGLKLLPLLRRLIFRNLSCGHWNFCGELWRWAQSYPHTWSLQHSRRHGGLHFYEHLLGSNQFDQG